MTRQEPTRRRGSRRRRLAQVGLVFLAALVFWYGLAWVRRSPASEPVAVIAHRGGSDGGAPEGTIGAFEAAIGAGADWLEFDVRRTADGVLVVLHDATVDRTTDGSGPIAALTLAEAQALDAGGGARIPTVEDVVDLAKRSSIPILPEIKDGPAAPGLTRELVALLRANNYLEHSVIQAFEAATLEELRRLEPDAKACWLTGLWQFDITSPPADATYLCPMAEMLLLNPDMIRQAHEADRRIYAWWGAAESALGNRILEAYGVDGLILEDVRALSPD